LAYTTDSYLNKLDISKKINVCVMVNSGDLLIKKNRKLSQLFKPKIKSRIDTIRFATHFREVKDIIPHLKEASRLKYKVIINLMQANDRTEKEIQETLEILKKAGCVSVVYFADSLGKMKPSEISNLFYIAKKYWENDLGIHTHDNKGLALLNCIEAIKSGVKWIDATIQGMGRGAGNIQTEIFLAEIDSLKNNKYNLEPIYRLSEGFFLNLKKKYNWGKSLNYYLAAEYNIHPTYIQTIESDSRYSSDEIYDIINYLKKIDARSYDKEKLTNFLDNSKKNFRGAWNAKSWCKNKNILLIGSGKSSIKYKEGIENFIEENKCKTLNLNVNSAIKEKFITYHVESNENRIIVDLNQYINIKKKIILPIKRIKSFYKKFSLKNSKDYGLKIEPNTINIMDNYCILPNSHIFGYALALCLIGQCKKIYLTGFDGNDFEDLGRDETIHLLKQFKKNYPKLKIISLTPTLFPVEKSSIYAKNL